MLERVQRHPLSQRQLNCVPASRFMPYKLAKGYEETTGPLRGPGRKMQFLPGGVRVRRIAKRASFSKSISAKRVENFIKLIIALDWTGGCTTSAPHPVGG
jgi:hypothetical protein